MCLVVFALGVHPRYPLVVAANRDEFHHRPTAAAGRWHDAPHVIGGRDLEKYGSWLAVSTRGTLAVVTNVRNPAQRIAAIQSRGALVSGFVAKADLPSAEAYVQAISASGNEYDGFNLLAGDAAGVWFGSNRAPAERVAPGVHGLSNHRLNTPWPKVVRSKQRLEALLADDAFPDDEALFDLLADREVIPDSALPSTGVPLEWERRLSPPFIVSPDYGTRCSTLVLVGADGHARLSERTFDANGDATGTVHHDFTLDRPIGHPARN